MCKEKGILPNPFQINDLHWFANTLYAVRCRLLPDDSIGALLALCWLQAVIIRSHEFIISSVCVIDCMRLDIAVTVEFPVFDSQERGAFLDAVHVS